mgnify:CR=1 FL=1
MNTVAAAARAYIPEPQARPMAEVTHRPAAVVSPLTTCFCSIIVPAPINPMPVTTCDAMREGSNDMSLASVMSNASPYCDIIMKSELPNATRKWVLNPASFQANYSAKYGGYRNA